jgi:predicted nuclease of restriction endonuclease-like RecB superfamily
VLTRDLLLYRIRNGQVTPLFLNPRSPDLLPFCESLTALAASGTGTERGVLEEQAQERATGFPKPKVAAGLTKLLFDGMTFEEPSEEAARLRRESFDISARVLRSIPETADAEGFEQALKAALPRPPEEIRAQLYADHPENRRMLEWEAVDGPGLIHRYNMAQVQGLVVRAQRLSLKATKPELLRVRRLLRWLKFFRLVPEVQIIDGDLTMEVEGPAAILSMEKKYGLQLAQFVGMVPILARYELRADIELSRKNSVLLILDERSGLVPGSHQALGFVPPEIDVILQKLKDGPWSIDPTPTPRPMGATGLCVPDVAFRRDNQLVAIEFFHQWHRHALTRRLSDLRSRPDPELVLAIDEKLLKEGSLRAELDGNPQIILFRAFPSERGLRKLLEERLGG